MDDESVLTFNCYSNMAVTEQTKAER